MIQRRTLRLRNLLSGSKRSSSHFREFELTAEGQEHMKMTFSYEDNYNLHEIALVLPYKQRAVIL